MAKYTVELSTLISAHAYLTDTVAQEKLVEFKDAAWDTAAGVMRGEKHSFMFGTYLYPNPNEIITNHAKDFIVKHVGDLTPPITDNKELNDQLFDQLCQNFVRHFYGYEIGQENPEYWFILLRSVLEQQLPIWAQGYQQLFIDKAQWITNTGQSDTLTKTKNDQTNEGNESSIAGSADTPQNDLNFKLNTGDPAQDYNFAYASDVNGAKSRSTGTANANGTSDTTATSQGRNQVITNLLNGMLLYADGIYFDLWDKCKAAGLFMQVF